MAWYVSYAVVALVLVVLVVALSRRSSRTGSPPGVDRAPEARATPEELRRGQSAGTP